MALEFLSNFFNKIMSKKNPAADQNADSKAWTAVQHKTIPGPRVIKTSEFK